MADYRERMAERSRQKRKLTFDMPIDEALALLARVKPAELSEAVETSKAPVQLDNRIAFVRWPALSVKAERHHYRPPDGDKACCDISKSKQQGIPTKDSISINGKYIRTIHIRKLLGRMKRYLPLFMLTVIQNEFARRDFRRAAELTTIVRFRA